MKLILIIAVTILTIFTIGLILSLLTLKGMLDEYRDRYDSEDN
jgi:hypothetical protein